MAPNPASKFDVVRLGFVPGRKWRGLAEVFVEELRGGTARVWRDCRFFADGADTPFNLLTGDPEVSFSYDGYSLIALSGELDGDVRRATERLREAARRLPNDIEQQRMM